MNDSFANELRDKLLAQVQVLAKSEAGLQKHLRGGDGRLEADYGDVVAFTEMDEVLEQLDESARQEVMAIRQALDRLEAGTYRACASCGHNIGDDRLRAMPSSTQCVRCAA